MNTQVGDRITYIDKLQENNFITRIITDSKLCENIKKWDIKILKIERPKYEIIEEKKELLTEEEKEYIKAYAKFNDIKYDKLRLTTFSIEFINKNTSITCYINTLNKFKALNLGQFYTKEELEL